MYWSMRLTILGAAFSLMTVTQIAMPGNNIWNQTAFNVAVPYWTLSIAGNITMTILILIRLISVRSELVSVLGADYALQYTSLIAIMVESAFLYAVTSVAYLIAFALNSNVQNLILPFHTGALVRNTFSL